MKVFRICVPPLQPFFQHLSVPRTLVSNFKALHPLGKTLIPSLRLKDYFRVSERKFVRAERWVNVIQNFIL